MKKKGIIIKCVILLAAIAVAAVFLYTAAMRQHIGRLEDDCAGMRLELAQKDRYINALQQENELMENPEIGVAYHGPLSVNGTDLVDQYGIPVQLRGVSSHGILWYPQYGNFRSLKTVRDIGANVFRIAMYTTGGRGYDKYPDDAMFAVRSTLENALGADMYAIVDWHVLAEKDPNVYLDEAMEFFDKISSLYADEPGVIYEICNEPNGQTRWEDIKAFANQVIPVIRKNSPEAVILVGTPNYSTKISEAANDPLSFHNIMYTYHFYADSAQGGNEKNISAAREKGVCIFVSEWGFGSEYDELSYRQHETMAGTFLDWLDENSIGWVCWSLSNKDEGHSILKPGAQSWSKWGEDELTEYGKFVFGRLKKDRAE